MSIILPDPAATPGQFTFLELQNATLKNAFPEADRDDVKQWIRDAHTELWDAADYTFKSVQTSAIATAGVITDPDDVADVFAIYDAYGDPLRAYYDLPAFYDQYNDNLAVQDTTAEAFCIVGDTIVLAPTITGVVSGYQIAYRKRKPTLEDDSDLTGFPDGYDMGVVFGAKAIGFTLINNPFADDFANRFERRKQQLMQVYTYGIDESGLQTPAYRPC